MKKWLTLEHGEWRTNKNPAQWSSLGEITLDLEAVTAIEDTRIFRYNINLRSKLRNPRH